jgi:hypothetical protein
MSLFTPFSILVISILGSHLFGGLSDGFMSEAMSAGSQESQDSYFRWAALSALIRLVLNFVIAGSVLYIANEVFTYFGVA